MFRIVNEPICHAGPAVRALGGGFTAPFTVLQLPTPLKMSYEAAKKRGEPDSKIVEELPQMRREAVPLVRQAVGAGHRAYVLVDNRSEGNAPLIVGFRRNAINMKPGAGQHRVFAMIP